MIGPKDARSVQTDLDGFDLALLRAIQADGRLTNQQLAESVNLSPSQCSRRRVRLETDGFIRGVHADLDPVRLGFDVLVFLSVSLSRQNGDTSRRFRATIAGMPEIIEAYTVAGEADYVLKARIPGLTQLADFINRLASDESVSHLKTTVALEEVKSVAGLPI